MDVYIEQLIKKNKNIKDKVIVSLMLVLGVILTISLLAVILLFSASLGVYSQIASTLGVALIVGLWYLVYIIVNRFNIEYEYTVINSSLDIDKIMAKKTRKRVISLDIKDAAIMARIDDSENNYAYKKNDINTEIVDLSARNENLDTYFIEHSSDGKRQIVVFQPTSKIVDALYTFNPRAVKKSAE